HLGTETKNHAGRSDSRRNNQRSLCFLRRKSEKFHRNRQARRPRRPRPRPLQGKPFDARHYSRRAHHGRRPLDVRVVVFSCVVSKSRCPLLLARGVSACLWFFLPLNREGKTVVGAVGKWESRVFCGIPKRS